MSQVEESSRSGQSFSIGDVFSLSFKTLGRHFAVFILLAAVFYAPAYVGMYLGEYRIGQGDPNTGLLLYLVLGLAVGMIMSMAFSAGVAQATFRSLRGGKVSFFATLQFGLGKLLPIFGVTIIASLAVMAGLVLLVIPGIILILRYSVAVPVLAVERAGVFGSLRRSAELTRNRRWAIFGIMLLLGIVNFGLTMGVNLIAPAPVAASAPTTFAEALPALPSTLNIALTVVVGLITGALGAIVSTVIYYRLRAEKEGVAVEDIASVFD